MLSIDEITKYLQKNLSEKRFLHTLGVAETAKDLARIYGADSSKAFLAGLIHDCAKEVPPEETISLLEKAGFKLTPLDISAFGILHAPLGAVLAKDIFGVDDEDVLNAVRYHTTGKENMSVLEKIVYIADFIEPNRHYPEADEIRELAKVDLDKAALRETDIVLKFTIDKGRTLHTDTIHTRNYLLKVIKEGSQNEN